MCRELAGTPLKAAYSESNPGENVGRGALFPPEGFKHEIRISKLETNYRFMAYLEEYYRSDFCERANLMKELRD